MKKEMIKKEQHKLYSGLDWQAFNIDSIILAIIK